MDNVDIPTHDVHLKGLDCLIATIIRKKESSCITVCDLNEAMPEQHMAAFTHGTVPGKDLPKVEMKLWFITACSMWSKNNGVEYAIGLGHHKVKPIPRHILSNKVQGGVLVIRLANSVAKAMGWKISREIVSFLWSKWQMQGLQRMQWHNLLNTTAAAGVQRSPTCTEYSC
jgi:hypothetical protein